MKADDQVYPRNWTDYKGDISADAGLTVRDYIAIQAMAPLISAAIELAKQKGCLSIQDTVEDCYKYADAMIAESNKGDGNE